MSNRVKLPFLMGCDPEFTLVLGNKQLNAGTVQALCKYTFSDDNGSMGMDCGMAEMRPDPANDIIDIAKNIKAILKKTAEKAGIFKWDVSSNLNSSGGHIHFGLPKEYTDTIDQSTSYYDDNNRNPKIHEYARRMFSFFLPVYIADDHVKTNLMRGRGKGSYGLYGDYRVDPHTCKGKKAYTFELRTPSAQWLCTPKTMLATFAYLATVHNEIINHPETFKDMADIVVKNVTEYETIERVAQKHYEPFLDPLMGKIKRAVKKFELYPKYRKEINWLFSTEKVIAEKEKCEYDILKGWGLEPKEVSLAQLSNKRTVEARMKTFDHYAYADNWSALSPFTFNDDLHISEWSHELAKRMYIFNWKINRQYIFFGFKKDGLNETIVMDNKLRVHIGQGALDTPEKQSEAKKALQKMISRFHPNTNQYIVGLPYAPRKENNLKFLIELIHYIEAKLPADYSSIKKEDTKSLLDLTEVKIIPKAAKEPSLPKPNSIKRKEAIEAGVPKLSLSI